MRACALLKRIQSCAVHVGHVTWHVGRRVPLARMTAISSFAPAGKVLPALAGFFCAGFVPYYFISVRKSFGGTSERSRFWVHRPFARQKQLLSGGTRAQSWGQPVVQRHGPPAATGPTARGESRNPLQGSAVAPSSPPPGGELPQPC